MLVFIECLTADEGIVRHVDETLLRHFSVKTVRFLGFQHGLSGGVIKLLLWRRLGVS